MGRGLQRSLDGIDIMKGKREVFSLKVGFGPRSFPLFFIISGVTGGIEGSGCCGLVGDS